MVENILFLLYSDDLVVEPDMSRIFCPDHKAAMVLFLDRVYGVQDQQFLLCLLENGFLLDLQAAVNMDAVSGQMLYVGKVHPNLNTVIMSFQTDMTFFDPCDLFFCETQKEF